MNRQHAHVTMLNVFIRNSNEPRALRIRQPAMETRAVDTADMTSAVDTAAISRYIPRIAWRGQGIF